MTCIVAVTDGQTVVIGGDSAGVGDQQLRIRADEKVFRKDPWGVGFTTSYRMGQILRYGAELPVPAPDLDTDGLDRFFVLEFVPAVREAFEEHGFAKTVRFSKSEGVTEEGQAVGGLFLIGFEGKIFEIREDFHLARPLDPFFGRGGMEPRWLWERSMLSGKRRSSRSARRPRGHWKRRQITARWCGSRFISWRLD